MRRLAFLIVIASALWLSLPQSAAAQSAIAGVVKDTSGAVLPGVSVEAASDALIERARTVVTDASGQYKIVDLRPGTYSLTFTLTRPDGAFGYLLAFPAAAPIPPSPADQSAPLGAPGRPSR